MGAVGRRLNPSRLDERLYYYTKCCKATRTSKARFEICRDWCD